jgi:hypothetical protein
MPKTILTSAEQALQLNGGSNDEVSVGVNPNWHQKKTQLDFSRRCWWKAMPNSLVP